MVNSSFWVVIAIVVLAIIAFMFFFLGKHPQAKLTPIAGIAFGFILAGLFAGENRIVGYILIGIGIVLSIIDIVMKFRKGRS